MAIINYPVQSSALVRIDYDDEEQTVYFTFKDGRSYSIQGIEQIEIERWVNSGSPGGYWNANLKGKY
jgi:hypothetical protein